MTREMMLQELSRLPNDVLYALFNLLKVGGICGQSTSHEADIATRIPKYRTAGALKGKIKIHQDFDEPLDELKEYMY